MKIVIDIPEEIVTDVKDYCGMSIADAKEVLPIILNAIHNGTQLPKGHGDLIDRGELLKQPMDTANYPSNYVKVARPIIEADKDKNTKEEAEEYDIYGDME